MRACTTLAMAVLAAALASASGAAQAPGGKGDQYDRFGRLVYGVSSGRQLHDDLSPQASAAAAAAPAAAASTLALLPSAPEAVSSAAASATGSSLLLEQDWQKASFGTGIGATGLQVADVDADGELEIVAGASKPTFFPNQRFYVLSRQGDTYSHEWASLPYEQEIAGVRVAQADADPALEILVGVASRIEIFDGSTGELERTVTTGATAIKGLSVADVDADGALELVFCDEQRLYVHDLATGAVEYQGAGLGGVDLAVSQADADAALEIAVANGTSSGSLVDGQSKAVEWTLPTGFGHRVRMADFDGDGVAELVAGFFWNGLAVYDTVSHSLRYEIPVFNLAAVRVADVEGDGALELVYGDAQWGGVHVLDGATGSEKWAVDNPEHGVTDIAVGDVDGDGTAEILFGAGYSSTGPDHLYVVDAESRTIVWQSLDESGPHSGFAFGDVDADGALELVNTAYESDSGYADGLYFVHDAVTKALEYRSGPVSNSNWTGVSRVRAVDVDADPQLELLVASGISSYRGAVYCFDGLSHAVQWTAAVDDGLSVRSLQVADLEGDGTLEVVVGTYKEHSGAPGHFVYVFDAVTGALEWRDPLATPLWPNSSLLRVANVDADPALEIVLSVFGGPLWIVDGETRVVQLTLASLGATALEAVDRDGDGRAEILVGDGQGRIRVVDPVTGALQELGSFGGQINGLAVRDLTQDGTADLAFCVADRLRVVDGASGVVVATTEFLGNAAGAHDSISVGDVDGDGATEIVVNQGDFGLLVLEAVVEADDEPPVVSLTAPLPGPVSGTVELQALASDDRGVVQVEFYLDGGLLGADASAPYSFSWPTATATPGSHLLSARAYDAAGNVGVSAEVPVVVPDQSPPSAEITQPANGATVSGAVAVAVSATDNVGVTRVELYVDYVLRGTDLEAPYLFDWNTTTVTNGTRLLYAKAYDAAGHEINSPFVNVVVANTVPGGAVYDTALRAPRCSTPSSSCDSGTLLVGRGQVGPEPNRPNTVNASCPDQNAGSFHRDESNDRIVVATLDGAPLASGKTVRVSATVWAWSGYTADKLDLYSAAQAASPVWTYRGTLTPAAAGSQVLSTTFVLPAGSLQVVRARFRYQGSASPCGTGAYDDHDDLVFAVESAPDASPVVAITAPTAGATVAGTVGVEASASDDSGVVRVDFLVDGQLHFSDGAAPWFFSWDTRESADGAHTLLARAYDAAGNEGQSAIVPVNVQNPAGNATFDATLRVPACAGIESVCDSGTLLVGRGTVGPEANQPNTLGGSCADHAAGTFHSDESNDRVRVVSVDGTPFALGKTVRVEATVWAWSSGSDYLDLYHTIDATNPSWTPIATLVATQRGQHTLAATFTLPLSAAPGGALQAVRARFRYLGSASACATEYYTDHDDIAFAVQP